MGRWEPNGPLRIAGRAVEMIKNAWGEKVFSSEIETVVMGDNRVHEVAACGYTDNDGIERIAAFVIPDGFPRDGDGLGEDLKNRVREKLGDSKVPSVVMLVDDLPRLAREKVDKRELVAKYLHAGMELNATIEYQRAYKEGIR
jgi:acyl-CoA synthetase (AMP-forming)/AMP-acid ligase II